MKEADFSTLAGASIAKTGIICMTILIILTYGEPDLLDAVIGLIQK